MSTTPSNDTIETLQKLVGEAEAFFWTPEGTTTTCCVLKLRSGFTVVGKSQCPEGIPFDIEQGRKLAFDDACEKLTRLEEYRHAMRPRVEVATPGQRLHLVKS